MYYHLIKLLIDYRSQFTWWYYVRYYYSSFTQISSEFELSSTVNLVLRVNQLTKWANYFLFSLVNDIYVKLNFLSTNTIKIFFKIMIGSWVDLSLFKIGEKKKVLSKKSFADEILPYAGLLCNWKMKKI